MPFEFRTYRRPFCQPLRTTHGLWQVREGIVLRFTAPDGRVGWGEIAPIAWFGSERIEDALAFCHQLPAEMTLDEIVSIPPRLPACQFGFEAAWEMLHPSDLPHPLVSFGQLNSYLLPTGAIALNSWQVPWQQGYRTFKWKIGVAPLLEELQGFEQLMQALPSDAIVRLDANGGLTWEAACQWLESGDRHGIEFLEQPLPPDQFDAMLKLSQEFSTPIALDESVARVDQLEACYHQGWRGIFVIKPAIAGFPSKLRTFCQKYPVDVVWSSVLETAIARHFVETRLIPSLPHQQRAIGFGVNQWFGDRTLDHPDFEQLWQSL
jgi:o-succinylbenzoate synthase